MRDIFMNAKDVQDFLEEYKLGKMAKLKFIESKKSIDKELESLSERIKELSKQVEVAKDNELTRELKEKYIATVLYEGKNRSKKSYGNRRMRE